MKKILQLLACTACTASTQLLNPAWSADPNDIKPILANIPVFVPTTADGRIKQVRQKSEKGKEFDVVFVAMSPAAASLLIEQIIRPAEGKKGNETTMSVMPITQMRESIASINTGATAPVEIAYIPDPLQERAAVSLMTSQGIKKDLAEQIARSQPVFFCPEPLVTVSQRVDKQERTFSPCGQDYVEMSLLILGSKIKGTRPALQAIPLKVLEESLLSQPTEKIKNILLLPTVETEQAIQKSNKTNASNTDPAKKRKK